MRPSTATRTKSTTKCILWNPLRFDTTTAIQLSCHDRTNTTAICLCKDFFRADPQYVGDGFDECGKHEHPFSKTVSSNNVSHNLWRKSDHVSLFHLHPT